MNKTGLLDLNKIVASVTILQDEIFKEIEVTKMSKLDELINRLCPHGVEFKLLGDVCNFNRGTSINSKNAIHGDIPVISGGQTPAFYHNEANRFGTTITVASSGAYAGFVNVWKKPIFCADSFSVDIKDNTILNVMYLYYYLSKNQTKIYSKKTGAGIPHVYGRDIAKFLVPVPPLEVQKEIVAILDRFDGLCNDICKGIPAEIKARSQQYEYYRDKLLDFKNSPDVEFVPLHSVTIWDKKFTGVDKAKQSKVIKYPHLFANELFDLEQQSGDVFLLSTGENTGWTTEEIAGDNLCEGEVIAIPGGKSRPVVEVMKYYKGKFVTGDNRILTSFDTSELLNKFIYYWMMTQGKLIDSFYRGAGIKHPSMKDILDIQIPVPPLEEQRRIVNILDKFTELTAELTAELKCRRKQYKYYRDKLLTFKRLA